METLQQAVAAGFTDLHQLKENKDLDPLRTLNDFQQLLAGLAFGQ
jgi:hypothetical protein